MDNQNERKDMFQANVNKLKEIGVAQSKTGVNILTNLWDIYRLGLYKTEEYGGRRFEDFRELCEEVIAPSYEDPDYFFDFTNIIERVFIYVHTRQQQEEPIKDENDKDVSVFDLITRKSWVGKLIAISQNIESCKTDEEVDQLFKTAFTGTRDDVRRKGGEIKEHNIPIKIPMLQRFNGDGSFTLMAMNINEQQVTLVLKKLGQTIELHFD